MYRLASRNIKFSTLLVTSRTIFHRASVSAPISVGDYIRTGTYFLPQSLRHNDVNLYKIKFAKMIRQGKYGEILPGPTWTAGTITIRHGDGILDAITLVSYRDLYVRYQLEYRMKCWNIITSERIIVGLKLIGGRLFMLTAFLYGTIRTREKIS